MTKPEAWTEPLLPDPLSSRRMRRAISEAASDLLTRRRDDWWQVASRWAGILAPIGMAATLAFAAVAVGSGTAPEGSVTRTAGAEDVFETLRTETAPVGFADAAPDDAKVVFAAIGAADRLEAIRSDSAGTSAP